MTAAMEGLARLVTGRRSAWAVIAGWVVVLAVALPLAAGLGAEQRNNPVSYLPAGAQSTALLNELAGFPGGDTAAAVVVYTRPGGLTSADLAHISAAREAVPARVRHAAGPGAVHSSADGAGALFAVELPSDDAALNIAVPQLRQLVHSGVGSTTNSLNLAVTGPAGLAAAANSAAAGIDGTLLIAAAAVVVVLLLLIYRSPVLWLLPMLAVTGGLFTAQAAITLLARSGALTVTDLSAGILNVLVFGAATDYALLLIARYREQLHTTADHRAALAAAVRATTPVITAAGGTVIAAMLCLLAATINSNRGLGPVAALGIAGGLVASLTLPPCSPSPAGACSGPAPPSSSTRRRHPQPSARRTHLGDLPQPRQARAGNGSGSAAGWPTDPGGSGCSPPWSWPWAPSACSTPASACHTPACSAKPSRPCTASNCSTRTSRLVPAPPLRS